MKQSYNLEKIHSEIRGPLYEMAMQLTAQGHDILKLNTGNPAAFGFQMSENLRRTVVENIDKAVAYCDFRGMQAARDAIVAYNASKGFFCSEDNIFIGNGVSELVTMTLSAFADPQDEILVPSPSYSLWTNSVYLAGAAPVFYTCDESSDWYFDLEDIKRKITPKTKGIVIINPNNPTGAVYPKALLEALVKVCHDKNLIIFADEIYDRLLFPGVEHFSLAAICGEDVSCVTYNGLSKSHFLCGFRCGWMTITGKADDIKPFSDGVVKLASMRLCANAVSQLIIPAALADTADMDREMNPGGRLYEQSKATVSAINKIPGLSVVPNRASLYIFPKIDTKMYSVKSDKDFVKNMLLKKQVLLVAGSGFDNYTNDHFRIVLLPQKEILVNAVEKIGQLLQEDYLIK